LPPALANLALNLVVTGGEGTTELALDSGKIVKGSSANAKTTLNLDSDTLRKVFLEFDMAAAMQAFMTGKIKVQGDMSQLMALQTAKPSQEQKDLFKKVLEQTA
jgi:putative sterol carrier protein